MHGLMNLTKSQQAMFDALLEIPRDLWDEVHAERIQRYVFTCIPNGEMGGDRLCGVLMSFRCIVGGRMTTRQECVISEVYECVQILNVNRPQYLTGLGVIVVDTPDEAVRHMTALLRYDKTGNW